MSRRKPTPGYIALMEKLQENAILEADQAHTDKVKEAMKKESDAKYQESLNAVQDKKRKQFIFFKSCVCASAVINNVFQNFLP